MIIMDGDESPLDVLSRAATMLQENHDGDICTEDAAKKAVKQLPTTKWKKERRLRAEYSRKSDPKVPEEFAQQLVSDIQQQENVHATGDIPLDMSVHHRGDPPSYAQSISNLGYRLNNKAPAVPPVTQRGDAPSGISMCDPIIDEHFRRSLGKDYVKVFSNNNVQPKETPAVKTIPKVIMEMMDGPGLSVDEHFAKALGDTWLKLNKKGNEINSESSDATALMSI